MITHPSPHLFCIGSQAYSHSRPLELHFIPLISVHRKHLYLDNFSNSGNSQPRITSAIMSACISQNGCQTLRSDAKIWNGDKRGVSLVMVHIKEIGSIYKSRLILLSILWIKLQIGPTALMRKKFRNINYRPRSYIHVRQESWALIFGALPTSETPPLRMVAEASPLRHRRGLTC